MAKLVQIQSSTTIRVTTGLQNKDVTNPDAHVPDRLKVNPLWPKHMVLIKAGVGFYPVEIKDWPSVKKLAEDKVITIGQEVEQEADEKQTKDIATAQAAKEEFNLGQVEGRRRRGRSLNEIAGGEDNAQ